MNQVSSAYIKLNGIEVVSPQDLNQNIYNISKDITLEANNTIEIEVRGNPGELYYCGDKEIAVESYSGK